MASNQPLWWKTDDRLVDSPGCDRPRVLFSAIAIKRRFNACTRLLAIDFHPDSRIQHVAIRTATRTQRLNQALQLTRENSGGLVFIFRTAYIACDPLSI